MTPPPSAETLLGRYRHFKGGEYELVALARCSETQTLQVVYRALYADRDLWVRPYAMFFEDIERDGQRMPRFARLDQRE